MKIKIVLILFLSYSSLAFAENKVAIIQSGSEKCIKSNGTPNHEIGKFPVKGNPNSFKSQPLKYCFPLIPIKTSMLSKKAKTMGITLTGIPIRPGTAGWYDASSPRKYSNNRSSGWNLEAITPLKKIFGIDQNNAHVDKRGLYHYHAMPKKLINFEGTSLIGYAGDGHEIHYIGSSAKSSWSLKTGERSTPPYGKFDGSFIQDYEFHPALGNLDECNGGKLNGKYVYFATDNFPFFHRCHWGKVSRDFLRP